LRNIRSRLKVLFIPCWYPSFGAENDVIGTFCREHARAAALYDDVAVLASTRSLPRWFPLEWKKVMDRGVHTFYTYCGGSGLPRIAWPFWHLSLRHAIKRVVRDWGMPDLIHTQDEFSYHVIRAAKNIGVPFVMSQHASVFGQRQLSPIMLMQYRYAFRYVKRVLATNPWGERDYDYYGMKAQVTWLPNAVDTSIFYPPLDRVREAWLLHASQFAPVKRFPDILKAFREVYKIRPDAILQIVGDGVNRLSMEQLARELLPEKSYHFHGMVSKMALADLMRRSRGFVLPSEFETFGCVLIEALACDCPVLTTRVGGIPATVPEGNGLFVEVGNVPQIVEGMLRLLDGTHGIEMGRVGRETRERFSQEAVGKVLHQIHIEATLRE